MWFYAVNGTQCGPVDEACFQQLIAQGQITAQTPVWKAGMTAWLSAGQVPELASFFDASSNPPLPNERGIGLAGADVSGGGYGPGQAPFYGGSRPYGGGVSNSYGTGSSPVAVPDYLVWAIIETFCCCLPLGIAGIIFAVKANGARAAGDYLTAQSNAHTAKICLIIGMIGGFIAVAIQVAIQVAMQISEQG